VEVIVEIKKMLPKWVRTMRIQRDIPAQLIEAGVKKSNLGELVYRRLEDEGSKCQCIRCREVGHQASRGIYPDLDRVRLLREEYEAVGGREIFLSAEDPENDVLMGFLRLRMPSSAVHRSEIDVNTSLVRELHVYGPVVPLGERKVDAGQHRGYGEELLKEAERIAREEHEMKKMVITSGVGVREYYRKFGYRKEGPYMSRSLD
jgi:elongator complex protein 3